MMEPTTNATHSRQSSGSTTGSSSPVSPTFSLRGYAKYASSNSSSISLPTPHLPQQDNAAVYQKSMPALPDVVEDPMERDTLEELREQSYYASPNGFSENRTTGHDYDNDSDHSWDRDAGEDSPDYFPTYVDYDLRDGFYSDPNLSLQHDFKRRRSGDSKLNSFATRIVTRFPSLSRRKRASTLASEGSPEAYHSTPNLSRSASERKSFRVRSREFAEDPSIAALGSSQFEPIEEDGPQEFCSSPMELSYIEDVDTAMQESEDPFPRSTTPILPPLLAALQCKPAVPSPLQSPSVAPRHPGISGSTTPSGTPHVQGALSPVLGRQTSFGSFHRVPLSPLMLAEEIPPIMIADPNDRWAERLGHANFSILPEPYLPPRCDLASCSALVAGWSRARSEYAKHLARTITHFGGSSKILRLTEEKWAETDAEWRSSLASATAQGRRAGDLPPGYTLLEPAPVARIPTMNDPSGEGKFPQLGDDDIVGPMVQAAPMVQHGRERDAGRGARRGLLKLLGRFPGRMGRSHTE